ncbi:DUF3311 domain-containing protein [Arthrobacter sp. ok362]|uniref:DUF3311 domain-containing protein n=1 Tax=Arthrobacter sp. ok362 TaxID=1761745 RepID=UPI0020C8EA66|nr:DUF3311 domain-containing protein [Arthrobacter sp. ok362]
MSILSVKTAATHGLQAAGTSREDLPLRGRLDEEASMSSPDVPTRAPARPGPYIVTGILLTIAIVVPLFVPAYSVAEPSLAGMPFFYWYQMAWIPITSALIGISYWLVSKEDRRRREAVRVVTSPEEER